MQKTDGQIDDGDMDGQTALTTTECYLVQIVNNTENTAIWHALQYVTNCIIQSNNFIPFDWWPGVGSYQNTLR